VLVRFFIDPTMNHGWCLKFSPPFMGKPYPIGSNLFAITDTNGDGQMSFLEWCSSPVRPSFKNENHLVLYGQWAKYDTANVGYLTRDEAVNRRAQSLSLFS
jgi:hypothetical protein